jgi:branched-subunit amino acid aminotransferase/4-amino-4-deoxychorismate lyase
MWMPTTILINGQLIPFADAKLHPLSLAVTYATTVFEGLRRLIGANASDGWSTPRPRG